MSRLAPDPSADPVSGAAGGGPLTAPTGLLLHTGVTVIVSRPCLQRVGRVRRRLSLSLGPAVSGSSLLRWPDRRPDRLLGPGSPPRRSVLRPGTSRERPGRPARGRHSDSPELDNNSRDSVREAPHPGGRTRLAPRGTPQCREGCRRRPRRSNSGNSSHSSHSSDRGPAESSSSRSRSTPR